MKKLITIILLVSILLITGCTPDIVQSPPSAGYGATGGTATYTIASSDATAGEKSRSNSVCDGVADDVQILAGINSAGSGSTICLLGRNFYTSSSITLNVNDQYLMGYKSTIHYSGAGSALIINGLGIKVGLNNILTVSSSGANGILLQRFGLLNLSVQQIGSSNSTQCFTNAGIAYDPINAYIESGFAFISINIINCQNVTDYGIYLPSASGKTTEAINWYGPAIYQPQVIGIVCGDNASYQTHMFNTFDCGVDSQVTNNVLVSCNNRDNTFNLEFTPSSGNYDVLLDTGAIDCKVETRNKQGLRIWNKSATARFPLTDWWNYETTLESLDGFQQNLTGTGNITYYTSYKFVTLSTGSDNNSTAQLIKWSSLLYADVNMAKNNMFEARVSFQNITNHQSWIIVGDIGTEVHYGFKVVNNKLYGTSANGTTESTIELATLTGDTTYLLKAVFNYVGGEIRFLINGTYINSITTNLPTGISWFRLLNAYITNTSAVEKTMWIGYFKYSQQR